MRKAKAKTIAEKIQSAKERAPKQPPHVVVEARAGTGKTTTLVEGLRLLRGEKSHFTPSLQQQAVWDAICQTKEARSACFVAFNKSIALELSKRVPEGTEAKTMHSMGFSAVRKAFDLTFKDINQYRTRELLAEILGIDSHELRYKQGELMKAVEKLVGLCKANLVGFDSDNHRGDWLDAGGFAGALDTLARYYDVDLNGIQSHVFELVPRVLELAKDVGLDRQIDFDDMIWLPVVLGLPVWKYDLLLVDEAQDLNRCQQELALMAGRRLILCGDPKQAIYGFAGADSESMDRMMARLSGTSRGCIHLPLTVTRRCGRVIVAEANKIVPDFSAHETCCDGLVHRALFQDKGKDKTAPLSESCYAHYVGDGDMILCRVNAPLVSECFKFLKAGRKANIQGRDIGQSLIGTIKKCVGGEEGYNKPVDVLIETVSKWLRLAEKTENAKPNPSEARLISLQDRHDCIVCFTEDSTTVQDVVNRINAVFSDNENGGILLSSVHKAKGLEADRVFILQPEGAGIPHPMSRSDWQRGQEMNLLYVAITRAKTELVYVG